jgi:hypothetical protein
MLLVATEVRALLDDFDAYRTPAAPKEIREDLT